MINDEKITSKNLQFVLPSTSIPRLFSVSRITTIRKTKTPLAFILVSLQFMAPTSICNNDLSNKYLVDALELSI